METLASAVIPCPLGTAEGSQSCLNISEKHYIKHWLNDICGQYKKNREGIPVLLQSNKLKKIFTPLAKIKIVKEVNKNPECT